jgi:hypothetical protein
MAKGQRLGRWWQKGNNGADGKKGWPQRGKGITTAARMHKGRRWRQTTSPKDGDDGEKAKTKRKKGKKAKMTL